MVRAVTLSPLIVPQCQTANFTIQAALDSNGLSNSVGTISAEVFRNGENVVNLTLGVTPLSTQLFRHGLAASSILEGLYYFCEYFIIHYTLYLVYCTDLPVNPNERDSVELQVICKLFNVIEMVDINVLPYRSNLVIADK